MRRCCRSTDWGRRQAAAVDVIMLDDRRGRGHDHGTREDLSSANVAAVVDRRVRDFYGADMTGKHQTRSPPPGTRSPSPRRRRPCTCERENVEDAATYVVVADKLREVDAWEVSRLAAVCQQVRREADKRRNEHQAAIPRSADTHATPRRDSDMITELTGEGFAEIGAVLREASTRENRWRE
jgi:hypothetical protein